MDRSRLNVWCLVARDYIMHVTARFSPLLDFQCTNTFGFYLFIIIVKETVLMSNSTALRLPQERSGVVFSV